MLQSAKQGGNKQVKRDDIEKRLKILAELSNKGTIKEDTLRQDEINLQKDMEIVLLFNELFEKQKTEGRDETKEQEILSYFVTNNYHEHNIRDDIKIRKWVKEAMRIIQLIYKKE